MTLLEQVRKIIGEQLGLKPEDIDDDKTFIALGGDSLEMVEILMKLEEAFDIEIPEKDAEKIDTITKAVEYLKERGM